MSKLRLIKQLKKKNSQLNQSELENIIYVFINSIKQALKRGQECEIRNFGSFRLKKLKANPNLRNPKTNELIYRPERIKIKFKASKELNRLIND